MHENTNHPHRRSAAGYHSGRSETLRSLEQSLAALEGDALSAALQVASAIELLASDDITGALEALDQARDEVQALR